MNGLERFEDACGQFRDSLRRANAAMGMIAPEPEQDSGSARIPVADEWPVLDPAAMHGLAGEVVKVLEPHTEADPVALLVSCLAEVGVMLNRAPHLILEVLITRCCFGRYWSDRRVRAERVRPGNVSTQC